MHQLPPEVATELDAVVKWSAPRLFAKGSNMLSEWRRKRKLRAAMTAVVNQVAAWPASRALSLMPQIHGASLAAAPAIGILENGEVSLRMGLFWRAPFPARNVSIKMSAHLVSRPGINVTVRRFLYHAVRERETGGSGEGPGGA